MNDGSSSGGMARTWVHVDGFMMGLGGDDSWSPRVHKEFLLQRHKEYRRADGGGGGGAASLYESSVWLLATDGLGGS
jgi:hypothetical protein